MWRSLRDGLLELLSPAYCPGCDLDAPGGGFCPACGPLIEPPPRWMTPPAPCAAACLYAGPLADAIKRLKYGGRTDILPPLVALLAEAAMGYAGEVGAIIPVPLHPARLRRRGFNQAGLLSAPVGRALGVPVLHSRLRRIRPTPEQAGLDRAARERNLRGAFAVRGRLPPGPLLLIDDVRTTGATLVACAQALSDAGAEGVRTLALAQTDA